MIDCSVDHPERRHDALKNLIVPHRKESIGRNRVERVRSCDPAKLNCVRPVLFPIAPDASVLDP
jgi:hypothetical protein